MTVPFDAPMHQVLPAFIAQAGDLLRQMETELQQIEQDHANTGAVQALYRAVHILKGSAGIFGLHHIVASAHVVGTVLDEARQGRLTITPTLAVLLRSMRDHLSALVALANDQGMPAGVSATPLPH